MPICFIVCCQVIEEPGVHLHEGLEDIIDKSDDSLVPMLFADPVECGEHDGHDDLVVLFYQGHDVLIVPEVESSFGNLNIKNEK